MNSEIAGFDPNLLDYIHDLTIPELEILSDYALYLIDMKERIYGEYSEYGQDEFEQED